jgi:hypothetical protein
VTAVEGFEQFVKVALETEGLVVSAGVKFAVTRKTKKTIHHEIQRHGYEVDLIGARQDRLVLASVKSFFGSNGVTASSVTGTGRQSGAYRLLNDPVIRDGVVQGAADRFGYDVEQVHMRLYVGKWARTRGFDNRAATVEWCSAQIVGGGPIMVFDASDVVPLVRQVAASSMYINDPVIVALKVLAATESMPPR